jgi:hypothetical protein
LRVNVQSVSIGGRRSLKEDTSTADGEEHLTHDADDFAYLPQALAAMAKKKDERGLQHDIIGHYLHLQLAFPLLY